MSVALLHSKDEIVYVHMTCEGRGRALDPLITQNKSDLIWEVACVAEMHSPGRSRVSC